MGRRLAAGPPRCTDQTARVNGSARGPSNSALIIMHNFARLVLFLALAVVFAASAVRAQPLGLDLVSSRQIWSAAPHNAFTDLARFRDRWWCTFREGDGHVGGDGKIRVLVSPDGDRWASAALLEEKGVDLRDPKFSVTPDGRLMLSLGGSVYEGKTLKDRQPRVAFSADGREWTAPRRIMERGDWLWRVTWREGRARGISYRSPIAPRDPAEWTVQFVESTNGIDYRLVTSLDVPGRPNEGTVRFRENGDALALLRREGADKAAWIGESRPPYRDWNWRPAGLFIGGPNFLELPGGALVAGGRQMHPAPQGPRMFLGRMTAGAVTPELTLPSGGDCSYPGLVWHEGFLWASYYSSHEGRSAIYLAKVRVPAP